MCTDGEPQTSSTDVLCVLTDTHGHPMCGNEHPQTSCPTWAKITQTVHGKGQRAESKDQHADMCMMDTHGHPVCAGGHPRTSSHVGQNHPNSPQEGPAC
ncbi:unnamed protein product [Brassica rapa]|uniref:Uncharacterized protein n=1 Tax=Brassica campestris TaxID=3711 RepID=A0A8D9D4Q5_BRACM|nr:unnamed protein product [Brassica rapa]